jgi:propionyl-CoA carboxylase beta chain
LYRKEIAEKAAPAEARKQHVAEFREKFSNPYIAAGAGFVDDVIFPHETRPRLIAALELLRDKQTQMPAKKHGCMPL